MIGKDIRDFLRQPTLKSTIGKLVASLIVFIALVASFAAIADEVVEGDTMGVDTRVLLGINSFSNQTLDTVALIVTYSGNVLSVAILSALLIAFFAHARKWRSVVQVAFTMGGALLLGGILKLIFQRERPELWQLLTHESTYSFPSGHSMLTAALAVLIMLLVRHSRYRWYIVTAIVLYPLLVGFSRLYLGVHYPTDVLAGWCIGAAWALIVAIIMKTSLHKHA